MTQAREQQHYQLMLQRGAINEILHCYSLISWEFCMYERWDSIYFCHDFSFLITLSFKWFVQYFYSVLSLQSKDISMFM